MREPTRSLSGVEPRALTKLTASPAHTVSTFGFYKWSQQQWKFRVGNEYDVRAYFVLGLLGIIGYVLAAQYLVVLPATTYENLYYSNNNLTNPRLAVSVAPVNNATTTQNVTVQTFSALFLTSSSYDSYEDMCCEFRTGAAAEALRSESRFWPDSP